MDACRCIGCVAASPARCPSEDTGDIEWVASAKRCRPPRTCSFQAHATCSAALSDTIHFRETCDTSWREPGSPGLVPGRHRPGYLIGRPEPTGVEAIPICHSSV